MSVVSDTHKNEILDTILGDGALGSWVSVEYVALFVGEPGGGGVEIDRTTTSYERANFTNDDTNWGVASGGQKSNLNRITFPVLAEDWPVADHWALMSTTTGGSPVMYGLMYPVVLTTGETPFHEVGNVVVTVT